MSEPEPEADAQHGAPPSSPAPARGAMSSLYALTATVAACSILYELVLAQTLAALLGNSVMRYSVTIGCYLGALGLGAILCEAGDPRALWSRLARVELALSVLGGAAVPLFYLFDVIQTYLYFGGGALDHSAWVPVLFMIATHAVIVAIGVLSGFEVPLLLALGESRRAGSTHRVLGVDYVGSLVGSLLFPTLLLPRLGVMTTGFLVALANGLACLAIALSLPRRRMIAPVLVTLGLALALPRSGALEQRFLEKHYFPDDVESAWDTLPLSRPVHEVERRRSPYQSIDILRDAHPDQWFADVVSARRRRRPDYPDNFWLYLDGEYQLFSGSDDIYHEWFAHAPVQLAGAPPRDVLVLGGGDGLLLAELLRYEQVRAIDHVELDPEMHRLAREHPALAEMNGRPDKDPRVTVHVSDALRWLRRTRRRFDAIYIDMPMVRDYDHSKVYSREFYGLVRAHLRPDGYVMLDAPRADCTMAGGLWDYYSSTLVAAGFSRPYPVITRITLDAPPLRRLIDETKSLTTDDEVLTGEAAKEGVRALFTDKLSNFLVEDFIFAFARERAPSTTWREHGPTLDVFGPAYLEDALLERCAPARDPAKVNSIARPTLPRPRMLAPIRKP
ncbi:MAG: hypothetical protein KC468_13235 [Myxococcales bacterium]|nr:hypothetical protein [Myxococcales bacterium]